MWYEVAKHFIQKKIHVKKWKRLIKDLQSFYKVINLVGSFKSICTQIKLDVTLILSVFTCCLFHNLILGRKEVGIQRVLHYLDLEATLNIQGFIVHPLYFDPKVHVGIEGHTCENIKETWKYILQHNVMYFDMRINRFLSMMNFQCPMFVILSLLLIQLINFLSK